MNSLILACHVQHAAKHKPLSDFIDLMHKMIAAAHSIVLQGENSSCITQQKVLITDLTGKLWSRDVS